MTDVVPHIDRIDACFTSRHWKWTFLTREECPPDVVSLLSRELVHIDAASWGDRVAWGGLFVNGIPASLDTPLPVPCKIEYYEPRFRIEDASGFFPPFQSKYILFEDEWLVAAFKPPGLPCMPAREQTHYNLKTYIEKYLGVTIHMPSRLDMSTQGLVIMSKCPSMHSRLQRTFEGREIKKFYLLESGGEPDWKRRVVDARIKKDPRHPVLRVTDPLEGQKAVTIFKCLEQRPAGESSRSLILARPLTGRTHQIRVHVSSIGHPITGDNFYDGPPNRGLRLLSYALELLHPETGLPVRLTVPPELLPEWALVEGFAPVIDFD